VVAKTGELQDANEEKDSKSVGSPDEQSERIGEDERLMNKDKRAATIDE
jgi:hypothetical protein